jgi:hypothetical protein
LGRPAQAARATPNAPAWSAYAEAGLDPAFAELRLVARAITPAKRPIRFHTRFFLAAGQEDLTAAGSGDGELEDVGWYAVEAALGALPTPGITEKVLAEALAASALLAERRTFVPVRFTARGARLYIRRQ